MKEYKKHPTINFLDSINHSMMGNLSELTKGGFIVNIITTVMIIGKLVLISQCSN